MSRAPPTTPSAPWRVGWVAWLTRSCGLARGDGDAVNRGAADVEAEADLHRVTPHRRGQCVGEHGGGPVRAHDAVVTRRAQDRASRARPGPCAGWRRAVAGSSPRRRGPRWRGGRRPRPRPRARRCSRASSAVRSRRSPPRSSRPQVVSPTARLVPVSMRTTVAGPSRAARRPTRLDGDLGGRLRGPRR